MRNQRQRLRQMERKPESRIRTRILDQRQKRMSLRRQLL